MPYIDTLPERLQRAFRLLDENRDILRAEIAEQRARDGFDDEIVTQSLSEWAAAAGTTAGTTTTPERPARSRPQGPQQTAPRAAIKPRETQRHDSKHTPEKPTTTSGWGKAKKLVRPNQGSGNEDGAAPII